METLLEKSTNSQTNVVAAVIITEASIGLLFNGLLFITLLSPRTKIYNLIKVLLALQVVCSWIHMVINILKLPQFLSIGYPERVNFVANFVMSTGDEENAFCHFLAFSSYAVSGASASCFCLSSVCRLTIVARGPSGNRSDRVKKSTMAAVLTLGLALTSVQVVLLKQVPPEELVFYKACFNPSGTSSKSVRLASLKYCFAISQTILLCLHVIAIVAMFLTAIVIRVRKRHRSTNANFSKYVESVGVTHFCVIAWYAGFEHFVARVHPMTNFKFSFYVSQCMLLLHGVLSPLVLALASSRICHSIKITIVNSVYFLSHGRHEEIKGDVAMRPILSHIANKGGKMELENETTSVPISTGKHSQKESVIQLNGSLSDNMMCKELDHMKSSDPNEFLGTTQLVDVVAQTLCVLEQERLRQISQIGDNESTCGQIQNANHIQVSIERPDNKSSQVDCRTNSLMRKSRICWESDLTKVKTHDEDKCKQNKDQVECSRQGESSCSNDKTVGQSQEFIESASSENEVDQYKGKIFIVRSAPKDFSAAQPSEKLEVVSLDSDENAVF